MMFVGGGVLVIDWILVVFLSYKSYGAEVFIPARTLIDKLTVNSLTAMVAYKRSLLFELHSKCKDLINSCPFLAFNS